MIYSEKFLYKSINIDNNFKIWMGFPGSYSFSMSSLGFLWLFKILDESEDILVERICSDTEKTFFKPSEINAFGFSFYFDFDFLEVFKLIEKYNFPLKASERQGTPFIFAGGPVVTANPEPYKDFFDFFIVGDGEDVNINAITVIKNNINLPKSDILKKLAEIEGVYVPKYSKNVVKTTKKLTNCIYSPIISEQAYFKNTFIIEMARGCANRCGFCLASYLNLPVRSVPDDELFNAINLGLEYTNKIAFLGAQVSAHPKFEEVCDYIYQRINNGENIEMNFSSLRVDAIKDNVIKTLAKAGQKNITLAIEAGSENLRKFINKNISNEQILNSVEIIKRNGLKGIKFYGMLGIPTETPEDINELISLAAEIKKITKGMDISFGFSTFVPKPHTPFQWLGREETKTLEKKINYIQKEFRKLGINANISSPKWDYWQAVLSRGDATFGDFLIRVYKNRGNLGAFKNAAKNCNLDADFYALTNYDINKELPWDFIDLRPGKTFLIEEYSRLKSYRGL